MKKSREKLKAELLAKAEAEIEMLLDWHEANEKPSWTEIEEEVLQIRQNIGQELSKSLLKDQGANRPVPGPSCKECGQEMSYKGQKPKKLKSSLGKIELERGYYYCESCRVGFSPSGQTTGS